MHSSGRLSTAPQVGGHCCRTQEGTRRSVWMANEPPDLERVPPIPLRMDTSSRSDLMAASAQMETHSAVVSWEGSISFHHWKQGEFRESCAF